MTLQNADDLGESKSPGVLWMPADQNFPGFDFVCGSSLVQVTTKSYHDFKVNQKNAAIILLLHSFYGNRLKFVVVVNDEKACQNFRLKPPTFFPKDCGIVKVAYDIVVKMRNLVVVMR
jgi:hypothetical protein